MSINLVGVPIPVDANATIGELDIKKADPSVFGNEASPHTTVFPNVATVAFTTPFTSINFTERVVPTTESLILTHTGNFPAFRHVVEGTSAVPVEAAVNATLGKFGNHPPTLIANNAKINFVAQDIPDYNDLLDGIVMSGVRRTVTVTDGASLAAAIADAQAGDTIVLESNRTYTQNEVFTAIGTATQPIIVQGLENSAWNGRVTLNGEYTYLINIDFSQGSSGFVRLAGLLNKVLGCTFAGRDGSAAINVDRLVGYTGDTGGRYGEIAYNDFGTPGAFGLGDTYRHAIRMWTDEDGGEDSVHRDLWIHHNHFHDSIPRPDGTKEASVIVAGEGLYDWTTTFETHWYIEQNLFKDNVNTDEAVFMSMTRGNVFQKNTINNNAENRVVARHGGGLIYASNWNDTEGNVQLHGDSSRLVNNLLDATNSDDLNFTHHIEVFAGDQPWDSTGSDTGYNAAKDNWLISNSRARIIDGVSYDGVQFIYPAVGTVLQDQGQGMISRTLGSVDFVFSQEIWMTADSPLQLTTANVGPAAMDNAPSGWQAARIDESIGGTITANPNATPEAVALLQKIIEFPQPPRQIFSGHHVAAFHSANDVPNAWDANFEPGGEIYELNQLTGVWPWLWGTNWDAAWVGEDHDYAAANSRITAHHAAGGVTEIMVHARVPGAEEWRWDDYDKIDIAKLITPGTNEYNGWRKMMDEYAVGSDGTTGLKQLFDNDVPILFRPFHEFNRTFYWWSYNNPTMTGPRFIELWKQTFDYYTINHGLNNLIWMWTPVCGAGMSPQNTANYYPGSDYVDIIGVSNYRGTTWDAGDQADIEYYALNIDPTKVFTIAEGFAHGSDEPDNWPNHTELGALDATETRDHLVNDWPFSAGFMYWDRVKAPIYYPNPEAVWNDPLVYNLRKVMFTGNFESGVIQGADADVDGFLVDTLREEVNAGTAADPQVKIVVKNGYVTKTEPPPTVEYPSEQLGVNSPYDGHIVGPETPESNPTNGAADPMTPRKGNYCYKILLTKDKDYRWMNNYDETADPLSKDKPRGHVQVTGSSWNTNVNRMSYDEEWWLGYSVYLPSNYEIESGVYGQNNINQIQAYGEGVHWAHLIRRMPGDPIAQDKWVIAMHHNDHAIEDEEDLDKTYYLLGDISGDLGKWTDFVFRIRLNPFDVATNPATDVDPSRNMPIAGALNRDFPANTGIFQAWKSTGPVDGNGDRAFIQCTGMNIVNAPVGIVPCHRRGEVDTQSHDVYHSLRSYPGYWKRYCGFDWSYNNDSTIEGPIVIYFDEIYLGSATQHGTGFRDVNPSMKPQP